MKPGFDNSHTCLYICVVPADEAGIAFASVFARMSDYALRIRLRRTNRGSNDRAYMPGWRNWQTR